MNISIQSYNGNPITFQIERNEKMMINATEMAKAFDKQVTKFMSLESTQEFVKEALKSRDNVNLKIFSQSDLYYSSQKTGTWMHRILALKFAAWLSPAFELWVYSTIDQLLFGNYTEREVSLKNSLRIKREMEEICKKEAKTGDDFEAYLKMERQLKLEKNHRSTLTRKTVKQICGNMFNEEDFEAPEKQPE